MRPNWVPLPSTAAVSGPVGCGSIFTSNVPRAQSWFMGRGLSWRKRAIRHQATGDVYRRPPFRESKVGLNQRALGHPFAALVGIDELQLRATGHQAHLDFLPDEV